MAKNTITIDWVEVNKQWFDWLGKSANTSWNYRKSPNSSYKIDVAHDEIWYTIRWWGNWPLQGEWDYFIKKIKDSNNNRVWEAIDSDWVVTTIPDEFEYFNEDGKLSRFNNWESIRKRAIEYWNTKDKSKIKSTSDINTLSSNNIHYYWWDLLKNLKDKDMKEQWFVSPQTISDFVYPYIDSNWKRLRMAPASVTKWAIIRRPSTQLRYSKRKFI